MPGDYLDLSSDPNSQKPQSASNPDALSNDQQSDSRKFVGVHFVCCDIYSRIYINRAKTAYAGNCPRCLKKIELKIGPGGTSNRFFTAG